MKLGVRQFKRVVLGVGLMAVAAQSFAAGTSAYVGKFRAACMALTENGLNFVDVIELKPVDDKVVDVHLSKVFYAKEGCPAKSVIGSVHLPKGQWVLGDQVVIDGRKANRVMVNLQAGEVTVKQLGKVAARGSIKIEGDKVHVRFGKLQDFNFSKDTDASSDKDLRWVHRKYLAVGDPQSLGEDKYPTKLAEDIFVRQ